jgi:dolichol-phosphate mannosyltransferase
VFNERENVEQLLADLTALEALARRAVRATSIILVDDGSTDQTGECVLAQLRGNITVLRHERNRGPGAAFDTAFRHLLDSGLQASDLVVTLEGDATSDPGVFPRMLKRLEEGDDIVLASPYLYGGGFSEVRPGRVLVSHLGNFLSKLVLNIRGLATFSCFFRIYRGRCLLRLQAEYPSIVSSAGFECAAEVLIKAVRLGLPVSEVPFRVDWSRRRGQSKMRILKTSRGYLGLFWHLRRARRDGNPGEVRPGSSVQRTAAGDQGLVGSECVRETSLLRAGQK